MGRRKLLICIGGRPMITLTVAPFLEIACVERIVVVVHNQDRSRCEELLGGSSNKIRVVVGGRERQDSVYEGLKCLKGEEEVIVIHDGARPLVTDQLIRAVVENTARKRVGTIAALPVSETVKRVVNGRVVETLPRRLIWSAQTPQAFPADVLYRAYREAMRDGFYTTDDAALCERLGYPVEAVRGDHWNIKITVPDDLLVAEMILRARGVA